eukprot:2052557-Alexandrium_andersonii.AAC.1
MTTPTNNSTRKHGCPGSVVPVFEILTSAVRPLIRFWCLRRAEGPGRGESGEVQSRGGSIRPSAQLAPP